MHLSEKYTISQSIASTRGFWAEDSGSSSGGLGVSTHPVGFSKISARYEGIGYQFSIICSVESRWRVGVFSCVRCTKHTISIRKTRMGFIKFITGNPFLYPSFLYISRDGCLEKRSKDGMHPSLVPMRASGTRVTESR